jgi:small-conductance mechanosensitive channel
VSEHPCFEVTVGVDYSSDVHQVMAILKKVDSQPAVLKVPGALFDLQILATPLKFFMVRRIIQS